MVAPPDKAAVVVELLIEERAWNNLNNNGAGCLLLTKPSQEAHSWSTQRLRWFRQEQKKPARMFKLFHARF